MDGKRKYPADALGITVELVDGPILDDDGKTTGATVISDTLVHVDRRYSVAIRRKAAAEARRLILEGLPDGELASYAADLADIARKLGPPSPVPATPGQGYVLEFDRQARQWFCPCCGKGYRLYNTYLWNHLRKHGLEPAGDGRWVPAKNAGEVM